MTSCISFCGLSQVSIVSTIGPDKYQPSHRKITPFSMNLFITNILHLRCKYLNLRFLDYDQWNRQVRYFNAVNPGILFDHSLDDILRPTANNRKKTGSL